MEENKTAGVAEEAVENTVADEALKIAQEEAVQQCEESEAIAKAKAEEEKVAEEAVLEDIEDIEETLSEVENIISVQIAAAEEVAEEVEQSKRDKRRDARRKKRAKRAEARRTARTEKEAEETGAAPTGKPAAAPETAKKPASAQTSQEIATLTAKLREREETLREYQRDIAKAESELKEAQDKAVEVKVMAANLKNDFDNFRRRNQEATANAKEEGINKVVAELLPVLDNFDRARPYIKDDSSREGFDLMEQQCSIVLAKFGVSEIEAVGNDFDPNLMNVVVREENPEMADKVIAVLTKGYIRGTKVIRHAIVKIGY
ncbi:MAG: nucleotide exchange factor GrpE [Clostridiaceae bacterium]|jgi:molecular chaperone GrpE|nr:nucleotide exchange factor GrpE [Clostridiaceae bacterium]